MSDHLQHLVFYDGNCGLCDRMVQFVFKEDKNKRFAFAPLQGETASQYLKRLPAEVRFTDSLILVENFRSPNPRIYMLAKGALRIAWLLRWPWMLLGWLSFLPGWMFNWIYRIVANNRHYFFPKDTCFVPPPNQKERFLP
jgi:predicted DCC family thiol-disulfide oxidoreductase YuxK